MNSVRDLPLGALAAPAAAPARTERTGPVSMTCVIPCRNESRNLDLLLPVLCDTLPRLPTAGKWCWSTTAAPMPRHR
jgi:hypothetical protein